MQIVGWEPFTGPVLYLDCGVNSFLSVPCSVLKRGQLSWGGKRWKWEGVAIWGPGSKKSSFVRKRSSKSLLVNVLFQ